MDVLSDREREVCDLYSHGYTAARVARDLFVSPRTVQTHLRHAYEKLGIHGRDDLIDMRMRGEL